MSVVEVNLQLGFEVLAAVVIKSSILWDITPCSPLKVNRRFGETYRLHLLGRRISQTRKKQKSACFLLPAGILFALFLDPEDGGDMFLRNVG
jgi:hypothetical protein